MRYLEKEVKREEIRSISKISKIENNNIKSQYKEDFKNLVQNVRFNKFKLYLLNYV